MERSQASLLEEVIGLSFEGEPALQEQARELYRKPPPLEVEEDDAEFTELVSELCLQDEANSGDLKMMKDDIDKKTTKRLLQRKHDFQREQAEKKKARLARAAAKKKARKRINPKLAASQRRQARRAAPAEPPAPTPPPNGPTEPPALTPPAAAGSAVAEPSESEHTRRFGPAPAAKE